MGSLVADRPFERTENQSTETFAARTWWQSTRATPWTVADPSRWV